jgi:3-deoxy-D-manno-octulosonic-acid transferase
LADAAAALLSDPALRQERGDAGRRIVAENRGALQRLMALLEPLLAEFPDS